MDVGAERAMLRQHNDEPHRAAHPVAAPAAAATRSNLARSRGGSGYPGAPGQRGLDRRKGGSRLFIFSSERWTEKVWAHLRFKVDNKMDVWRGWAPSRKKTSQTTLSRARLWRRGPKKIEACSATLQSELLARFSQTPCTFWWRGSRNVKGLE